MILITNHCVLYVTLAGRLQIMMNKQDTYCQSQISQTCLKKSPLTADSEEICDPGACPGRLSLEEKETPYKLSKHLLHINLCPQCSPWSESHFIHFQQLSLVDNQFNTKISDFGLAKLLGFGESHLTKRVMGTFRYVAPEYANSGLLNEKSDFYTLPEKSFFL